MKTTFFKLFVTCLFLPAVVLANPEAPGLGRDGKYTKQKRIKKEFKVSPEDLLNIENSYGNLDITTWDQNRVVFEILIETNGNDEERVQKRLEDIQILFKQNPGEVIAETVLDDSEDSWWSGLFGNNNNVNIKINYIVKAPVTNDMKLSNDYGAINLDKLKGDAAISCDYGRIMIGQLLGDNNILNFDYTQDSHIGFVRKARINADYSEFNLEEAGSVELNADYSESNFQKVENLSFSCDYGSLKAEKVKNLKGKGDYLGVKLGAVYGVVLLEMDYGGLSIEKIMPALRELDLDTEYTSIKLGYDPQAPFSFDIHTAYGDVEGLGEEGFTLNRRHQSGGENHYQGYHLNNSTGGKILVDSSYGSVTFKN